jgi:hypothetical protein
VRRLYGGAKGAVINVRRGGEMDGAEAFYHMPPHRTFPPHPSVV